MRAGREKTKAVFRRKGFAQMEVGILREVRKRQHSSKQLGAKESWKVISNQWKKYCAFFWYERNVLGGGWKLHSSAQDWGSGWSWRCWAGGMPLLLLRVPGKQSACCRQRGLRGWQVSETLECFSNWQELSWQFLKDHLCEPSSHLSYKKWCVEKSVSQFLKKIAIKLWNFAMSWKFLFCCDLELLSESSWNVALGLRLVGGRRLLVEATVLVYFCSANWCWCQ